MRLLRSLILAAVVSCQPGPGSSDTPIEFEPITSPPPARAQGGMVVSANARASQVGRAILRAGGNAVDAAIATGFALAVTHPVAGNIGGGGFMVIRFPDGSATALDFREKAPLRAHARMFLDENGEYSSEMHHNSHLSVGVPGTVAGFAKAHGASGKLPWEQLVQPAVDLAADGIVLTQALAASLARLVEATPEYPATMEAFSKGGMVLQAGEVLRQPDLARTLARIMRQGRDGFYTGETAELLVAEMERGGGLITAEDLARYEAKERTPVSGTYRGYDIISMYPPSSGGTLVVEMLNILEGYDVRAMGHNSAEYIHHLAEAMRRAYRDRAHFLADPDFADVPLAHLTSKAYADELRQSIDPSRAGASAPSDIELPVESDQTTHYSVVDADGMAVAVTYTLEQGYGSKITVPGAGFLLNNEMGDFNAEPGLTTVDGLIGTDANLARPEQRMVSNMTPTIIARDGELVAIIGSPGGRTIQNTVVQLILNVVEFDMNIQEAVDARRIHHQWLPDEIRIEAGGVTAATVQRLREMGHTVMVQGRQGRANSIMIDPRTGERLGAPDRRGADAGAAGHD